MKLKFSISIILLFAVNILQAQEDKGTFNGNFSSNTQFFRQDDRIGANTELYKRQLVGSEAWLSTNYTQKGLTLQARFDLFNNSNLYDPSTAYTGSGIGYWSIIKEIDNIQITGGYFYEQFATGTVFRAFEDRALGLDYAIQGVRVKYTPFKDFKIKAFTGKQKFRFGIRDQVMRGANAEWSWHNKKETFGWEPGSSILNRTIDNGTMPTIVNIINDQPGINQFYPKYNVYLFNFYNTIRIKNFTIYAEYNGKTHEAIKDFLSPGSPLVYRKGKVLFGSLSYTKNIKKKNGNLISIGFNAQYKQIDSFPARTSPLEQNLFGQMNYLTSVTRANSYRLLARYNAVVQELGEKDYQADLTISVKRKNKLKTSINFNASKVIKLDKSNLFHELYAEVSHEFSKKFKLMLGIQNIGYNQQRYEVKGTDYPFVHATTPFGELLYKFNRKNKHHAIRIESQYLNCKQDLGSFINVLAEWTMAPHFSFALGDMYNIKPFRAASSTISPEKVHYYTVFGAYTHHATRFTLAYVKQVAGMNCTGGVCRVEPAFSGIKFTLSTNF